MPLDTSEHVVSPRGPVLTATQLGAYADQSYFTLCGARANVGGAFSDVW